MPRVRPTYAGQHASGQAYTAESLRSGLHMQDSIPRVRPTDSIPRVRPRACRTACLGPTACRTACLRSGLQHAGQHASGLQHAGQHASGQAYSMQDSIPRVRPTACRSTGRLWVRPIVMGHRPNASSQAYSTQLLRISLVPRPKFGVLHQRKRLVWMSW